MFVGLLDKYRELSPLTVYISDFPVCLCLSLSVHAVCHSHLVVSVPVCPSVSLCASVPACLSVSVPDCQSLSLSAPLPVCPSFPLCSNVLVCPSISFGVSLSARLFRCICRYQSVFLGASVLVSLGASVLVFLGASVPLYPSLSHCPFGAHVCLSSAPLGAYVPVSFGASVPVCLCL